VAQFQIAVRGDSEMVGKTLYIDEFAVVGDVDGTELPFKHDIPGTYKVVWGLHGLANDNGYSPSSLYWYGEFVGKLLTGMAYSYRVEPNEDLLNSALEIIADLKEAQGADGYLGTYVGGSRYSISTVNWDIWNQYHIISGLLEWYKLTNNEDALDIAKKCIDCIYETFKDRSYIVAGGFETNRAIAHGYTQMYKITGDIKYLNEAERIIVEDCKADPTGWYQAALKKFHFYQSNNSRWELLHMMMALGVLYEETGNQEYYDVMSYIWKDIAKTDIHNTGGFTTNEGAHGSPYMEGVVETCCTIAWLAFTNEYYRYSKSVYVADEFERSYMNGLLGSLLDNDKYCTYNTTPDGVQGESGSYDGRRVPSQQDISFQYNVNSPDMNCCQANLARGLGQLSQWALLTEGDKLYLNYYGTSNILTKVDGKDVIISQKTSYPLDGAIELKVSGLAEPTKFKLLLRVPTWAYGSTAVIDGERVILKEGTYYEVERTWENGDSIQLDIELSYHFWKGEQVQEEFASVYYGPILLTLDEYYAPGYNQKTVFDAEDFENAEITSGALSGSLMYFDIPTTEGVIRLVDYSSAGKYNGMSHPSTYWSWLTVKHVPNTSAYYTERWQTSNKYKVIFTSEIILERSEYYVGELVTFELFNYGNLPISGIVTQSDIDITEENGVYSFIMPNEEVSLSVKATEEQPNNPTPTPTPTPSDDADKGCGGSIVPTTLSIVLCTGAATIVKAKKTKKDDD
jgi:DUF1680 family protein